MDDIWELVLQDPALGVLDRVCLNVALGETMAAAKNTAGFWKSRQGVRKKAFVEALRSPRQEYARFVLEYLIEEHDDTWLKYWTEEEGSSCHLQTLLLLERRYKTKVSHLSSHPQLNLQSVKRIWWRNSEVRRLYRDHLFRFAIGESRADILGWMFRVLRLDITHLPDRDVNSIIRNGNDKIFKVAVAAGLGSRKLPFTVDHLRCCISELASEEIARTIVDRVAPTLCDELTLLRLIISFTGSAKVSITLVVFGGLFEHNEKFREYVAEVEENYL